MKIRTKITALMLCTVMLTLSLCSCGLWDLVPEFMRPDESHSYHEIQDMVTVSVEDGYFYTVTSPNPVKVNRGADATFTIEIREGYELDTITDGAMYENGVLTVPAVKYPTTVSLVLKKESIADGGDIGGGTEDDGTEDDGTEDDGTEDDGTEDDGTGDDTGDTPTDPGEDEDDGRDKVDGETPVVPTEGMEDVEEEEEPEEEEELPEFETVVLATPAPAEGYHFICWTLDSPAEYGGELLTAEGGGVFEVPYGVPVVANFVDNEHYVLLYRTNGGVTADGDDYYYQTFSNKNFYMPNTIHQNGTFMRDGYVLMRYTTNPNGTGDYTTLGGKIEVNKNGFIELWLKWGKVTDSGFTYELYTMEDGTEAACVKSYTGVDGDVVIPEKVSIKTDDWHAAYYPVKKIAAGAFDGVGMYTLVIPSTIHTIEDGAFVGCKSLHSLTVHDNLWQVSDKAFSDCPKLATYFLNAARNPVFAGSTEGLFCMKYEKIRQAATEGRKKIMVMSGSSSLYGFSAEQMEEAFEGEYAVINYGTNAGALGTLYLDAFIRFFGEGDIIIHAPEMNNANYLGGGSITYLTYRGTEEMYEVFSFVDMRKYVGFFDGLCVFNQEKRVNSKGVSYEKYGGAINKMTDLTTNKDAPEFVVENPRSSNPYNKNSVNAKNIANINAINERYNQRGTTMYYSFAPIDMDLLNETALFKDAQDSYVAKLREVLDYEVISHPSNYYYEHKYFYNSTYHPGITGRAMRTEALIADLKAQLVKEGRWEEGR